MSVRSNSRKVRLVCTCFGLFPKQKSKKDRKPPKTGCFRFQGQFLVFLVGHSNGVFTTYECFQRHFQRKISMLVNFHEVRMQNCQILKIDPWSFKFVQKSEGTYRPFWANFKIRPIFILTSWKFTKRLIFRWKWRWKHSHVVKTPFESFTKNRPWKLKHPVLGGFRSFFDFCFGNDPKHVQISRTLREFERTDIQIR